jgi:hypothetical protein
MADGTSPAETNLLRLFWSDGSFKLEMGCWFIAAIVAIVAFTAIWAYLSRGYIFAKGFEVDSAEFGFGDQKITIKPNQDDRKVAYRIWVELSTRKIGLPIDFEHDVIAEVYDSWYKFFDVTRELIKDIPVNRVRSKSTTKIIEISIETLNMGLRPHLTQWQARFRRWYNYQLEKDKEALLHPQDIQKAFPDYEALIADMKIVNGRLIHYRKRMNDLVHGL